MLKSVLYIFMIVSTTARLADIVYLIIKADTNLPVPVLVVTMAMIVYGIALIVKRILGNVTIKQFMAFYMIQTVMIAFNLSYTSIVSPLRVSVAETLIVGTFLDILINCCIVYFCMKQLRSHYFEVAPQPAVSTNRHV